MIENLIVDVIVGGVIALFGIIAKWQWPVVRSLFDEESRRQAAQISGSWKATEVLSKSKEQNEYRMDIGCRGGQVTGKHTCTKGPDEGKAFDLKGTYKDLILAFTWMMSNREGLESGTVTVKLSEDKKLGGHGLYIEPDDGKVYTSTFTATKI